MNLKRLIGGVAVAGVVGASTLGIGAGVANATTSASESGTAVVQPVDWHGGYGPGYGHDYRHDYRGGGWPIHRWHPWRWHW